MQLRVEAELGPLAAQWDALLDQAPRPSVFLRSWWLQAVATGRLKFVLVFEGEELIGGCALQESNWYGTSLVEFIGSGPLEADHLDVVVASGFEEHVRDAVFGWLDRPGSRVVDLRGMNEQAVLLAGKQGTAAQLMQVAPYSDLSAGFAGFMATRSKNLRRDVRQADRRMQDADVVFQLCDESNLATALDALQEMHAQQWEGESSFLAGWPRFRAAALAGIKVGEVLVGQATSPTGEPIATGVALQCGSVVFNYQSGRLQDPRWTGSGTFVDAELMQANPKAVELDWLRGTEAYKAKWATGERKLFRLRWARGSRARLMVRASNALHAWHERRSDDE